MTEAAVPRVHRRDIDGLRAVAVLSVLLFHFGLSAVPGGFVGVDVFFVISGFLITRLILDEEESGHAFAFGKFYLRRIRRLFPALALTVAATLIAGAFILPPDSAQELGGAAIYSITYLSNILFWLQSGYFDSASVTKPLLHTWSLSVEEQFYLLWPALIVISSRLFKSRWGVAVVLVLAGVGSFALNIALTAFPSAMFFLFPFRIFEFAIGAGAMLLSSRLNVRGILADLVTLAGLAAIVYSVAAYSADLIFPGTAAVLPCVGTGAILLAGGGTKFSKYVLENPVFVYIGKISYSLYLVHWPIVVFALAFWAPGSEAITFTWLQVGIVAAACLVSAALSYHLVEEPFRRPRGERHMSGAAFGMVSAILSLAVAFGGAHLWAGLAKPTPDLVADTNPIVDSTSTELTRDQKFQALLPNFSQKAEQAYTHYNMRKLELPWRQSGEKILLIGDSQGADFLNILVQHPRFWESNVRTIASSKYCQIHSDPEYYQSGEYKGKGDDAPRGILTKCEDETERFKTDPFVAEADTIILAFAWFPEATKYLEAEIAFYKSLGARRVLIIGRKDQPGSSVTLFENSIDATEKAAFLSPNAEVTAMQEQYPVIAGVENYFDMYKVFCNDQRCRLFTDNGYPIFYDTRHLTRSGCEYIGKLPSMLAIGDRILEGGAAASASPGTEPN